MKEKNCYELLLENVYGLMMIDKEGKLRYINSQCADYIHVDKELSLGKPVKAVFAPSTMEDLLEEGKTSNTKFYFEDGRMSISNQVQLVEDGEIIGVLEYDVVQELESLDSLLSQYAQSLKTERDYYRERVRNFQSTKYSIHCIAGTSDKIKELKRQIEIVSRSNSTVLITGETGTGKELVAHSIHNLSARAHNDLIMVNAAGIPETLIESELFGYEEGAFTGSKKGGKKGKFELADKGTLFIDEINQMPLSVQPKLLRALQEGEIDPVGNEGKSVPIDARIIVATNKDLVQMVKNEEFREDLYFRLNVFTIEIPPLRERLEDVPELVDSKIKELNLQMGKKITKVDDKIYKYFQSYDWPGNVRQLFNVIERAMNMAEGDTISVNDLDVSLFRSHQTPESEAYTSNGKGNRLDIVRDEAERKMIIDALTLFHGNKTQAADYLNIARPLLYQKMKRLNIQIDSGRKR